MSEGQGAWARWRAWPVELRWVSVGVPWVVLVLGIVAMVQRPRELGSAAGRLVFEDTFERDGPGPDYLQGEPDLNWA
jgi:hypothetical protein